jgi:hypothetical protein
MRENMNCADCGALLEEEEEYYNSDGEPICEYCADDYDICDDCGDVIPAERIRNVNNGDSRVCEYCANDYYECQSCNNLYTIEYTVCDDSGTLVCDDCYNRYYQRCYGCEMIIPAGDTYYIGDYEYCRYCYDEIQEEQGYIHAYNYKPYDFTLYGSDDSKLFYGVELEIDDGDDDDGTCYELGEIDEIYLKEDGSLSSGFEIVTHPATLNYHVNYLPWAKICSIARNGGYRSHDTSTCGLHIHASRAGFGDCAMERDLTIAKLMLLFDRFWDGYIVPFSRRNYDNLRRWAKKPNSNITDKDTASDAVQKLQDYKYDRYQAINLTNRTTVEFRIFRGTLKHTTILASIQWVDTLIKYCKATPLQDFARVTWEGIFADTDHVELREYMENRKLMKTGGM